VKARYGRGGTPRAAVTMRLFPVLPVWSAASHISRMFIVDEASVEAVRRSFAESGELAAAVELRRRFPGINDLAHARKLVRVLLSWRPRGQPSLPAAGCELE
jgi:hypothetical protein